MTAAFLEAFDRFLLAGADMVDAWNDEGNDTPPPGFPAYLPSFDEFLSDMRHMRDALRDEG